MFYSEEEVDKRFLKKLKKSKYEKDALLLKLILLADNNLENEGKTPTRVDFVEKREIDRSTLYSFNRPFQLLHADVKIYYFWVRMQQFQGMFWCLWIYILQKYMSAQCNQGNRSYKR